ncbi:MAG: hypothetical protein E6Z83_08205 [Pantoea sp.]|uniref:hypothetical protein n=1 Tax=Pantoea sp. TaxID=69393 RepID=UPI00291151ED|nr:hypothetical protein [Pantoea sp.]MDU5780779.1 hypothetical protein [Pantoea sp.]
MNLKQVFTAITCGLCMSMANASLTYTTSVDHKDVKYHIDQCNSSGGKFFVSGWYLSGSDAAPGDIKVYLVDSGMKKEVPVTRRQRDDVSDELLSGKKADVGFYGSLNIPSQQQSFSAEIQIVESANGSDLVTNYSCNSLR